MKWHWSMQHRVVLRRNPENPYIYSRWKLKNSSLIFVVPYLSSGCFSRNFQLTWLDIQKERVGFILLIFILVFQNPTCINLFNTNILQQDCYFACLLLPVYSTGLLWPSLFCIYDGRNLYSVVGTAVYMQLLHINRAHVGPVGRAINWNPDSE